MSDLSKPEDLRFATDKERRYALAYLRWLAGGSARRGTERAAAHSTYGLSAARGGQIRDDIHELVRDAAATLNA
jgi:hypothetical protein